MQWIDAIEQCAEVIPKRWKRRVSLALLAGFLVFPTQAQKAVIWYGQEKARQITEGVMPLLAPATKPPSAQPLDTPPR